MSILQDLILGTLLVTRMYNPFVYAVFAAPVIWDACSAMPENRSNGAALMQQPSHAVIKTMPHGTENPRRRPCSTVPHLPSGLRIRFGALAS